MKFKIFLIATLIVFSGLTCAAPETQDIELTKMRNAVSYDKSKESLRQAFSALKFLESNGAIVAYNGRDSMVINKKRSELERTHPLYVKDDFEADDTLLLQSRLSETDPQVFYLLFSEGESADPRFYFIKTNAPDKEWAVLQGDSLAVPGNGAAYVANRFNNTFTKRTKYLYSAIGLTEVKQPYFYVGLNTSTLAPLTIYAAPNDTHVVAQLPKGSEIEVILTDNNPDKNHRTCFLIKTPFGLLGWAWIPESQYYSTVVEGISFWGD